MSNKRQEAARRFNQKLEKQRQERLAEIRQDIERQKAGKRAPNTRLVVID